MSIVDRRSGGNRKISAAARHLKTTLGLKFEFKASLAELLRELRSSYPADDWSMELLKDVVQWCKERRGMTIRGSADWDIRIVQGGRAVRYVPQRGSAGVGKGVVGQIARKLEGKPALAKSHGLFGLTAGRIVVTEASHSGKGRGRWSAPDLIVRVYRSPKSHSPIQVHAIEVEERTQRGALKTSPQQVAQAFISGRGADHVWLMCHRDDWDEVGEPERETMLWSAGRLGVGLILFTDAANINTWTRLQKARPLKVSQRDRSKMREKLEESV
jgi:hypothetical protein